MEEGDSIPTGLEWENLAMQLSFSMPPCSSNVAFLGNGFGSTSAAASATRHRKEFGGSAFPPRSMLLSTPTKRSRASYHNMQNPCCQVEGCNLDLKMAKDYHRRHRICEAHSKSPKVVVSGMERRFCQQCSRFHDLSEFDDKKRSCRRRLSDHNARRRRVQPESVLSGGLLSPASYAGDQRQQNVLLNGLPLSLPNSRWENANILISRNALIRPSKPLNFSSPISNLNMDQDRLSSIPTSSPRILDQCGSTNPSMAPDLLSAHSLLSSNAWSFNEGKSEPESQMFYQGPSHQEEYQLFKEPYDCGTFYRSL